MFEKRREAKARKITEQQEKDQLFVAAYEDKLQTILQHGDAGEQLLALKVFIQDCDEQQKARYSKIEDTNVASKCANGVFTGMLGGFFAGLGCTVLIEPITGVIIMVSSLVSGFSAVGLGSVANKQVDQTSSQDLVYTTLGDLGKKAKELQAQMVSDCEISAVVRSSCRDHVFTTYPALKERFTAAAQETAIARMEQAAPPKKEEKSFDKYKKFGDRR